MTPPFPIVAVNRANALDILNGEYPLGQTTLYGYIKHATDKGMYYDKDGFIWASSIYSRKFKPTLLTKLLANTFYNPTIKVECTWIKVKPYELSELKEKINHCIELDDDVLTQFVEASEFKKKVTQSKSFDELVNLLLNYVFKPNFKVIGKHNSAKPD